MIEVIKMICYFSSLFSVLGLIIMNRYFIQERKNNSQKIEKITDKIKNVDQKSENYHALSSKALESYKMFLSKDLSGWIKLIQEQKSEFKKFENYYITHQSKINERLEKLEKND